MHPNIAAIAGTPDDAVTRYTAALLRALRGAVEGDVYDGYVPDAVALDAAGFIKPYVVLWMPEGDSFAETDLSGQVDLTGLRLDFATTSVAASPAACRDVAGVVRHTLTNFPLGTYHVTRSPWEAGGPPVKDTNEKPPRYFLARQWRLDTT